MRQKILLSAALLHNPTAILDEPLSGLDVSTAMFYGSSFGDCVQGRMIFYSSHVLEVLEKVCSGVVILSRVAWWRRVLSIGLRELNASALARRLFGPANAG